LKIVVSSEHLHLTKTFWTPPPVTYETYETVRPPVQFHSETFVVCFFCDVTYTLRVLAQCLPCFCHSHLTGCIFINGPSVFHLVENRIPSAMSSEYYSHSYMGMGCIRTITGGFIFGTCIKYVWNCTQHEVLDRYMNFFYKKLQVWRVYIRYIFSGHGIRRRRNCRL
jgi:hypothetical protein